VVDDALGFADVVNLCSYGKEEAAFVGLEAVAAAVEKDSMCSSHTGMHAVEVEKVGSEVAGYAQMEEGSLTEADFVGAGGGEKEAYACCEEATGLEEGVVEASRSGAHRSFAEGEMSLVPMLQRGQMHHAEDSEEDMDYMALDSRNMGLYKEQALVQEENRDMCTGFDNTPLDGAKDHKYDLLGKHHVKTHN